MFRKLFLMTALVLCLVSAKSAFGVVTWEANIDNTLNGVEQRENGSMYMDSSDLELPTDGGKQHIGMRWLNVDVPKGATIAAAYVEFTVDETESDQPANLIIEGELVPNADPFATSDNNVSNRVRTAAQVKWSPPHYPTVGEKQQTDDISSIITEIVNQDGWVSGNSIVIIIYDDPDNPSQSHRTVESGSGSLAPLLHIEYTSMFAHLPNPADGSLNADTWASLAWQAGETAVTHEAYFSDNFDAVNDRTADAFAGNPLTNSLVVGFPGFPFPDGLIPGTTYYWAIDEVEADGVTKQMGPVWSFSVPPRTAYAPVPADGAKFMDPAATKLAWTAGFGAKLHTVYFGDNFDDVSNAAGGIPMGMKTFTPPSPLEAGKVYYWRVDEMDPPNTYKGDVWSFETAKEGGGLKGEYFKGMSFNNLVLTRTDPQIDFAWGNAEPDPLVGADNFSCRWTGQVEAAFTETYTFYTNSDDGVRLWVDGKPLVSNWTDHGDTEDRGKIDLVAGQKYSVVMEMYENGGGAVAQLRWESPSTPKQLVPAAALSFLVNAHSPTPANGIVGVKLQSALTWKPGEFAKSHDVYFGTDADAVANATKASPEFKGTKQLGSESLDPGALVFNSTYYWRIDEIDNANPDSPWVGNVWSFNTGDFLLVDDFEAYNDIDPPAEGSNRIFDNWIDGFGTTTNGALVGNDLPPYAEQVIVHGGGQSMIYRFDNAGKTSEATLTLVWPRDWTAEGATKLSLWLRGDPGNAAERVYVALNGNAVVYHDDAAAAQNIRWTEWVIDLATFGVDLTNVNSITIGVGTKNAPAAGGGTGTVYFDDIRLVQ